MRVFAAASVALMASACATSAAPNYIGGQYFMGGDRDCKSYRLISSHAIECINGKGQVTGQRTAMTAADLQYYSAQMAYQQSQYNQMMANINAGNARLQQQAEQIRQQGQYTAPPVNSYGTPRGVTYTLVGNEVFGSNGVTYRRVGNSVVASDGTTCQIVGQNLIC